MTENQTSTAHFPALSEGHTAAVGLDPAAQTPAAAQPREGLPMPHTYGLHAHRQPWWKGLLVILTLALSYGVIMVISQVLGFFAGVLVGFTNPINPITMLALNLSWASMILIAPLVTRLFYKVPKGSVSSLEGRLRWGRLGKALLWILPLYLLLNLSYPLWMPSLGTGAMTAMHWGLLAVAIFTTPLQAAGEEYTFRGAANIAAASWAGSERAGLVVGMIVSNLIFGLAHGATDPWLIVYYPLFGLGCALLAYKTRGLETSIVVHAANNVVSFVLASLSGADFNTMFDRSNGVGGPFIFIPLALMAVIVAVTWYWEGRNEHRLKQLA